MNDKVVPIGKGRKDAPEPPQDEQDDIQLQCSDPCGNRAFTLVLADDCYTALCTACHHPAIVVAAEAVVIVDECDDSESNE
jgi:hypothetical protein